MVRPRGYYAKWNIEKRERQLLYDSNMRNLKTKQINLTKQKHSHRYTEQTGSHQKRGQ